MAMGRARTFRGLEARRLIRRARTAALGTLERDGGAPYVSAVNVAADLAGWPLIFVSRLARHTRNLMADPRASLLIAELPETGDALAGPRVTVLGRFEKAGEPAIRRRYLARHPAVMYADFADFAFWRLVPDLVHAVAGFGRIETLAADDVFPASPGMAALEDSMIADMNENHAEAIRLCATRLQDAPDGKWRIAAIDTDGADVVSDARTVRLCFDVPVQTMDALRQAFGALSARARSRSRP